MKQAYMIPKKPCENKVIFYVPRGYDHKAIKVRCGNTDPWGDRTICDSCAVNPSRMTEIKIHEDNIAADNAWLRSAGWGEM